MPRKRMSECVFSRIFIFYGVLPSETIWRAHLRNPYLPTAAGLPDDAAPAAYLLSIQTLYSSTHKYNLAPLLVMHLCT